MDEFQKMCAHRLIQGKWELKQGDRYYSPEDNLIFVLTTGAYYTFGQMLENFNRASVIYLPRLNDLVGWLKEVCVWRADSFLDEYAVLIWSREDHSELLCNDEFTSSDFESALLQAFMWTQGLKWTGEKWEGKPENSR